MFTEKHRTVTITDEGFDPPGIPGTMGHPVLVEFVNKSKRPHQVEFTLPQGAVRLVEPLAPGRRTFIKFVTDDLGVFDFRCPDDERIRGKLVINAVM